jgi:hypothetical protein
MAFQHAPLSDQELGTAVLRMVGSDVPKPMRLMAARGLAPLPPRDMVVAIYQLWVLNEQPLAEESAKTIESLPTGVLLGALGDGRLHAGVLDFLGRKLVRKEDVLERIVRHPNVANETLAGVARLCPESICNVLAENQQRWLKFPAIVESLYQNPNCRMSVAHHMLELAVRQGVELKLPNIEEIKLALGDIGTVTPEDDARFDAVLGKKVGEAHAKVVERVQQLGVGDELDYDAAIASYDEFDPAVFLAIDADDELSLPLDAAEEEARRKAIEELPADTINDLMKLPAMFKIRIALLGTAFQRSVLIRDVNKIVALSVIRSPKVKESEAIAFAAVRTLPTEVVREIVRRRDWIKLYQVKQNLVLNPKTPLKDALTLLGHLYPHDVRKVARSKNIPSALAQAARRKEGQRR